MRKAFYNAVVTALTNSVSYKSAHGWNARWMGVSSPPPGREIHELFGKIDYFCSIACSCHRFSDSCLLHTCQCEVAVTMAVPWLFPSWMHCFPPLLASHALLIFCFLAVPLRWDWEAGSSPRNEKEEAPLTGALTEYDWVWGHIRSERSLAIHLCFMSSNILLGLSSFSH